LPLKRFLIEHLQQVRHVIVLPHRIRLSSRKLQKNISGEQWLLKGDRFAAIFVRGFIARQRRGNALPRAIFDQLLLSSRFRVGHEPL
jgi:hypothetical protein